MPPSSNKNSKALEKVPVSNKLTFGFNREQVDLVKNLIAKGTTDDELKLFLYTAQRTGLDPLTKQIYCMKRKNNKIGEFQMTIQTGIDGYRAVAGRSGELAGIDDPIYDTEKDSRPNKASVTVYRFVQNNKVGFTATARWDEYAPDTTQPAGFMWKKMPYLMLGKVAEALALRKAFPNDLTGVYTKEEMDQADTTAGSLPKSPQNEESEQPEASQLDYVCSEHGETMRLNPAGVSKQGRKYPAFWSCTQKLENGWCKAPILDREGNEMIHNKETGLLEKAKQQEEEIDINDIVPGKAPVNTTAERAAKILDGEVVKDTSSLLGLDYNEIKIRIGKAKTKEELDQVRKDADLVKKTLPVASVAQLRSDFNLAYQNLELGETK